MQKKYNLFSALIIVVLIAVIFGLLKCKKGKATQSLQNNRVEYHVLTQKDTVTKTKTVFQYLKDTVYLPTLVDLQPLKRDTLTNVASKNDTLQNVYVGKQIDSNVTLSYRAVVSGRLDSLRLGYFFNTPQTVYVYNDSVFTVTNTINRTLNVVHLTASTQGKVGLQFQHKKGWGVGYGYGSQTKTHEVTFLRRIFSF